MKRGWPNSTASPSLTQILAMVPDCSALISLNTFMASMRQMTESGSTWSPVFAKSGESGFGFA